MGQENVQPGDRNTVEEEVCNRLFEIPPIQCQLHGSIESGNRHTRRQYPQCGYSSSETCSIQSTDLPSSASAIAICVMPMVAVAPCQCLTPGGIHTMSPRLISWIGPPHCWTRPT